MSTTRYPNGIANEVLVKIPSWLAKKNNLVSRELVGSIDRQTDKAIYLVAHASVRPSDKCLRCGQTITNPVSRLVGYGPYCSDELGIPRDFTEAQLAEIKAQVESVIVEGWYPKSQVSITTLAEPERYVREDRSKSCVEPDGADTPPPDDSMALRFLGGPPLDLGVTSRIANEEAPPEYEDLDYREGWDSAPIVTEERFEAPVRVVIEGLRIVVHSEFRLKDTLKAVPGSKWDPDIAPKGAWTYPATPGAADALALALKGETVDADSQITALRNVTREADARKRADDDQLPEVPSRTTAWTHQARAYHFAKDLPAAMLAMDMGTGKSKVAVDLACASGARRVLVLCPKSVVGVWPREFGIHGACPVQVVAPRRGPKGGELNVSKRAAEIETALDQAWLREENPEIGGLGPALVVVVNYESAWRDPMASILLSVDWDLVVLDESHRIKAPGGKASKFCARLGRRAAKRLCLTGTPMPHSPLDVYAQYRFLDPGIFGTSFTSFRAHYAILRMLPGNVPIVDGYQREDELAEKMYRIGYRVMADDVLDLPEATWQTRTTQLGPKGQRTYDQLAHQLVADLEAGVVSAANSLVRLLRLQQVTSGWVPLDEPDGSGERPLVEVDDSKARLLYDVLEDLPQREPVVVACRFTADLDNVRAVAEAQHRVYAELSGRDHSGLADDATMRTDIDVLGVQIQAGGVGIDLTRAAYVVNYSVGYSLGDWEQWLKRTHRPGQTRHVAYINLVCENTIDEAVYSALDARKDLVEFVLGLSS